MVNVPERLVFAWWNTGLCPPRSLHASQEITRLAAVVVATLVDLLGIDCLALGEVSRADVEFFAEECVSDTLRSHAEDTSGGSPGFGLGLLHDGERIRIAGDRDIIVRHSTRKYKLARKYALEVTNMNSPLYLFVSHWPSRRSLERNDPVRSKLGDRLRDAVEKVFDWSGLDALVILVGDYNDEPFDLSLSESLLASRDRRLVQRRPSLFYNPFWRKLGELHPHVPGRPHIGCSGTVFHRSGIGTQWRTFDQMMFSKAFLDSGEWELNEHLTQIIDFQLFGELSKQLTQTFDHFPVVCGIERYAEGVCNSA